jgi:hypothetical protein
MGPARDDTGSGFDIVAHLRGNSPQELAKKNAAANFKLHLNNIELYCFGCGYKLTVAGRPLQRLASGIHRMGMSGTSVELRLNLRPVV